jgi:hypothetical protein
LNPDAKKICALANQTVLEPILAGVALPNLISSNTTQRHRLSLLESISIANEAEADTEALVRRRDCVALRM